MIQLSERHFPIFVLHHHNKSSDSEDKSSNAKYIVDQLIFSPPIFTVSIQDDLS